MLTIEGFVATTSGIHDIAVLKCSEVTWASAAPSRKASTSTYWLGLSTLRDHSKKILPSSARERSVKSSTSDIHSSLFSGRTVNLTTMKIMAVPFGRGTRTEL